MWRVSCSGRISWVQHWPCPLGPYEWATLLWWGACRWQYAGFSLCVWYVIGGSRGIGYAAGHACHTVKQDNNRNMCSVLLPYMNIAKLCLTSTNLWYLTLIFIYSSIYWVIYVLRFVYLQKKKEEKKQDPRTRGKSRDQARFKTTFWYKKDNLK